MRTKLHRSVRVESFVRVGTVYLPLRTASIRQSRILPLTPPVTWTATP